MTCTIQTGDILMTPKTNWTKMTQVTTHELSKCRQLRPGDNPLSRKSRPGDDPLVASEDLVMAHRVSNQDPGTSPLLFVKSQW